MVGQLPACDMMSKLAGTASLSLFSPLRHEFQLFWFPRLRSIWVRDANAWVGGSTRIVVELHNHLGHRFEMEVVTSALPDRGSHKGMLIDMVPKPRSHHLVRCIFRRFSPHIVHVHYWGEVDEPWYKTIFEIAAEFGCRVLQNISTPVAPLTGVRVDRNVLPDFGASAGRLTLDFAPESCA